MVFETARAEATVLVIIASKEQAESQRTNTRVVTSCPNVEKEKKKGPAIEGSSSYGDRVTLFRFFLSFSKSFFILVQQQSQIVETRAFSDLIS